MSHKLMELIASSEGLNDAGVLNWMFARGDAFEDIMAKAIILGKMVRDDREDARHMMLKTQIEAWSVNGEVWVYQWGRDCDLCESSGIQKIPASVEAFERAENDMYDYAEGPCNMHLISPEDAEQFEPTFRDRAAEMMNY